MHVITKINIEMSHDAHAAADTKPANIPYFVGNSSSLLLAFSQNDITQSIYCIAE